MGVEEAVRARGSARYRALCARFLRPASKLRPGAYPIIGVYIARARGARDGDMDEAKMPPRTVHSRQSRTYPRSMPLCFAACRQVKEAARTIYRSLGDLQCTNHDKKPPDVAIKCAIALGRESPFGGLHARKMATGEPLRYVGVMLMIRVEREPAGWRIYLTDQDIARNSVIKTIPGRAFDWQEKCWRVPKDGEEKLRREFGVELFSGAKPDRPAPNSPPAATQQTVGGAAHIDNAIRVQPYYSKDKKPLGALLCASGNIGGSLIARFKENYRTQGTYINSGGIISSSPMIDLIGSSAGALGASYYASGTLFMATANPATLMAHGGGVLSAVMGSSGIVSQAAFVPVAGALMPVLASFMAFQLLSTVVVMKQFGSVYKSLEHVQKSISRIIQRSEATFVGQILSAAKRLDDIEAELRESRQFTPSMITRLAVIEGDIGPAFERYKFLFQNQELQKNPSAKKVAVEDLLEDLRFKQNDAYLAVVLSILDLRIDTLRLRLATQENVPVMRGFAERMIEKATSYKRLWDEIESNPSLVEEVAANLKKSVQEMNRWERIMPKFLGGKKDQRFKEASSLERHAAEERRRFEHDLAEARAWGAGLGQSLDQGRRTSLVYWHDESGDHSFYTDDLEFLPAKNT